MRIRAMEDADLPQVIEIAAIVPTAPHWPAAEFTRLLQVIKERPWRRGAWVAVGDLDAESVAVCDAHAIAASRAKALPDGNAGAAVGATENLPGQDGAVLKSRISGLERVVGFALAAQVAGVAEVEAIVTDPAFRRRGLGRALLQEVTGWARQIGAERLVLEARSTNIPALSLYTQLGFVRDGIRRAYYRNPDEDAVLLSVPLGPVPE